MRYQCCDSIRPSRDVPTSCHILPREGGCQVHSSREDKMPHFPSLQPLSTTTVGRTQGILKYVFRGLSAHAGGSASCDSATTLFKTSQRAPLFYTELQKHPSCRSIAFQPCPTLTSTLSSPPILSTTHLCSLCFPHLERLSCSAPYGIVCDSADGNCFVTAKYGLS